LEKEIHDKFWRSKSASCGAFKLKSTAFFISFLSTRACFGQELFPLNEPASSVQNMLVGVRAFNPKLY